MILIKNCAASDTMSKVEWSLPEALGWIAFRSEAGVIECGKLSIFDLTLFSDLPRGADSFEQAPVEDTRFWRDGQYYPYGLPQGRVTRREAWRILSDALKRGDIVATALRTSRPIDRFTHNQQIVFVEPEAIDLTSTMWRHLKADMRRPSEDFWVISGKGSVGYTRLTVNREKVVRTWPFEAVSKNRGGGVMKADWPEYERAFQREIDKRGFPGLDNVAGWQRQADVIRWIEGLLEIDRVPLLGEATLTRHAREMMEKFRPG